MRQELAHFILEVLRDEVQHVTNDWQLTLYFSDSGATKFPAEGSTHDSGYVASIPATSQLRVLNGVIEEQVKSKKFTAYDLHCLLKKHGKDIVPLLMLDESGFNMLHQCIQHNRMPFLKVFQAHGYWANLIEQEIPSGSLSEYAGCTPKQIAERKHMRRLVKEIDRLSQQENSMSNRRAALGAARAGDLDLLKTMALSGNVDMKAKDSEGNNCVHWAAVSGNLDIVIYLTRELKLRADLLNEKGQTPLHVAVMYGESTLIPFLTKQCQLDPEIPDSSGKTPLQRTAENGDIATLSELLKTNVEIDQSLGVTAAQFGRQAYLEHTLTSYGLDHMYKKPDGKTCLMVAAENGHLKIVVFLINQYNIPLTDVSKQKRNVFHYVAEKGHDDVAKVLLEKAHADGLLPDILNQKDGHRVEQLCYVVSDADTGHSALPCMHLKRKYVHLFEKRTEGRRVDASPVETIPQSGRGPKLKKAVEEYQEGESTKDGKDDLSPTLLAIAKGHQAVAKLYLEAGGDGGVKDCFGLTGMHLAAMRGNLDMAVTLKLLGVSPHTSDEDGDTPLKVAVGNAHPELVNFFKEEELLSETQVWCYWRLKAPLHTGVITRPVYTGSHHHVRKYFVGQSFAFRPESAL